jgi:NhaP-type Na+/H+ or K+/H+ antiporter
MRAHHTIVIVAAILVGFGLALIFSSGPIAVADAGVVKRGTMDISEIQQSVKNLPVEHFNDMTFVFSDGDRTNF